MQLASSTTDLTGRVVARFVDYTDMPGMSLDLVATHRVGPEHGWLSLEQAQSAVRELSEPSGPEHPATAIFTHAGRFEAYELGQTMHGFDPSKTAPLELTESDPMDLAYARTRAGASLVTVYDDGIEYTPASFKEISKWL
jgi:hypothetical protein